MNLRNARGILLSLAITLTGTPTAYGIGLDTVQGSILDGTDGSGATQVSNLGEQIGSISYGELVEGSLGDSNDVFNNTGTAYDLYSFTVRESGLPYVITASSSSFIIAAAIHRYDATQKTLTPLQIIISLQNNGHVQFSGTFSQTGQYLIQIMTGDSNTGVYNLRLDQEIPFIEPSEDNTDPFSGNDDNGGNEGFEGNDDPTSDDDSASDDSADQNGGGFDDGDFFEDGDNTDF